MGDNRDEPDSACNPNKGGLLEHNLSKIMEDSSLEEELDIGKNGSEKRKMKTKREIIE